VDGSETRQLLGGLKNGPADNAIDAVRYDYHLPELVLFTTDQWHRPPWSAGTRAMSQQAAVATRPHRGLQSCTLAPASRPRYGSPPGSDQSCWLATCQD